VKGSSIVTPKTSNVAAARYLLGLLAKNGFLVRITRTMSDAETTDSINQPVLNSVGPACRMKRSAPNVR